MSKPPFNQTQPLDGNGAAPSKPPFHQTEPLEDNYWGDVGNNAMEGVKQAPELAKSMFNQAKQIAPAFMPAAGFETVSQVVRGKPIADTPYGQAAEGIYGAAKQGANAAWQGAKDLGNFAGMPYAHYVEDKPWSQTQGGKNFRERPISSTVGAIGTAVPLFKGLRGATGLARETFAGAEPNFLERSGAKGVNKSLGIRPGTVEDLPSRSVGQIPENNPGKIGLQLGSKLYDEGMSGMGPTEGYSEGLKNKNAYGRDVGKAISDIKGNNPYEWENNYNMLHGDSNKILKPILEKAAKFEGSKYPDDSIAGKWYRAAYDSLADKANENGGYLTFDHVNEELDHIGDVLGRSSEANMPIIRKIYGEIANVRDNMVENIASSAKKPELSSALKDANAGFSRYSRILPDIKTAASKESVNPPSLFKHPIETIGKAVGPKVAKGTLFAGKVLRGGSEIADKVTAAPGKAASSLFNKGKQMARNEQGSIFPKEYLPKDMKPNEMFTPAEQKFGVNQSNEQQYLANNDFKGALKAKWGMAANSGGSFTPDEVSVPSKTLSEAKAREFLKKAKGDKAKARSMAKSEGWSF